MTPHRHLNPQLLSTFVAIAEVGSFLRAAQVVGRSEAAVSLQMRRLEEAIGEPTLFRRVGRRKELTERGEIFLAHARALLGTERSIIDLFARTRASTSVKLGVPDDYSSLLPPIIKAFSIERPDVEIETHCQPSATLADMLEAGALELAIVTRPPDEIAIDSIRPEPLVWVAAAGGSAVRRDVLPLATFQQGCLTRSLSIEALAMAGRPFEIVFSSPSVSALLQPVKSGIAVAAMARCSMPDGLTILDAKHSLPDLPALNIALRRGRSGKMTSGAEMLADVIRTVLAA